MDKDGKTAVAIIGAAVLVFGGLGTMAVLGIGDDGGDESGYVKVACHDWVKDRLKSPATAEFSGEDVSRDGQVYVVTGAVDSANSFGAPIRNTYRCEAKRDGSASVLISLSGIDN